MADHRVNILPEGSSVSAPPRFDRENFIYWQRRMKIFIKASEYGLWDVFQDGNYIPTKVVNGKRISKCRSELNNDDKQQMMLNDKAVNVLLCAITEKEYLQISNLETAQEMWKALEIAYGEPIGEASSTGECSDDEEKVKICLVAEGEEVDSDSNSDNEVYDSEPTYDELLSEYNDMHSEFIRIAKELVKAKKKINGLKEKLNETPKAAQNCDKCIESVKKSIELKKTLEKITHGGDMLSVLNGNQRHFSDKSGIIKDPVSKRREKKRNKLFSNCFNSFLSTHCSYCNRAGHSTTSCYYKKNESYGKYKWVPKGTYVPKAKTNRSGPKRKWVPKYPPMFTSLQDISRNGRIDQLERKMLKRANPKINRMRASKPIPHISKTIHKRSWGKSDKAQTSMINYHRVPFNYKKRQRRYWVW